MMASLKTQRLAIAASRVAEAVRQVEEVYGYNDGTSERARALRREIESLFYASDGAEEMVARAALEVS